MPDDDKPTPPDPTQAFNSLLSKHNNDAMALATKLFDENYQHRNTIRDLKAKTPKDGDLVLSGDDAKEYQAFKALNASAADAKKAIEAVPELEKQNRELSSMESLREVASIGLDGSPLKTSVLKDLMAKFPEAVITFKTEKDKDGNETKVALVQKTDKDPAQPFAEFSKTEFSDYLPSLKVSNEAPLMPVAPGHTHDPKPQGGATSVFDQIRDDVKKTSEGNKPVDIDARFGRAAA